MTFDRRVVITGCGVISPLGNSPSDLWQALLGGKSGVAELQRIPNASLPTKFGGESREFDESIENFGPLDAAVKKQIRKGMKVMCREIKMGVAAAQLALTDSSIDCANVDRDRFGVLFGSDFITTEPDEFVRGVRACVEGKEFAYDKWAETGMPEVTPLWLLKYLPNMPACHVAIYNDLRGPNNSITLREASSNLAVAEAVSTIARGAADVMLAGATGSRIHPLRTVHTLLQEQFAIEANSPAEACRPFDKDRQGVVVGEGAAAILLEEYETAKARNATILGEVVGYGSSSVMSRAGIAQRDIALANVMNQSLSMAGMAASEIGHVHAHGLSTLKSDAEEARAIRGVFVKDVNVVAAKGNFGNLGASSGMVELIASLFAMKDDQLFPAINYKTPDDECPIRLATEPRPAGSSFLNVNATPQGQASAVLVKSVA